MNPLYTRPSLIFLGVTAILVFSVTACGDAGGAGKSVRGHVLDVQARSLTEVQSLTLRDSEGGEWIFETVGNVGFTPSHIREHMMQGEPMTVFYEERNNRLVATRVTD